MRHLIGLLLAVAASGCTVGVTPGVPAVDLYPAAFDAAVDRFRSVRHLSQECEDHARARTLVLEVEDATDVCLAVGCPRACVVHRHDGTHLVWIDYGAEDSLYHEVLHVLLRCVDGDGDGQHLSEVW